MQIKFLKDKNFVGGFWIGKSHALYSKLYLHSPGELLKSEVLWHYTAHSFYEVHYVQYNQQVETPAQGSITELRCSCSGSPAWEKLKLTDKKAVCLKCSGHQYRKSAMVEFQVPACLELPVFPVKSDQAVIASLISIAKVSFLWPSLWSEMGWQQNI